MLRRRGRTASHDRGTGQTAKIAREEVALGDVASHFRIGAAIARGGGTSDGGDKGSKDRDQGEKLHD